ncbi:MAG: hypothetical protein WA581_04865 [Candidatus Acidiferrales bacterium]
MALIFATFASSLVNIKWLGTHGDYAEIDVKTVRYGHQPRGIGERSANSEPCQYTPAPNAATLMARKAATIL